MHVYFYDRSFEGLLTVLFEAYKTKIFPDALLGDGDIPPMLMQSRKDVITDVQKAERVFEALRKKISSHALKELLHVWLSEQTGCDLLLLRYMRLIFDAQKNMEHNLRNDTILEVTTLARKVMAEQHLMTGFIRFQKTAQGIYVGLLAPRYNILNLLLEHFAARFADQHWMLYDTSRKFGFLHKDGQFSPVQLNADVFEGHGLRDDFLDSMELWFQNSWRNYCGALSIKERTNPVLQRRCMPARYWPYMVEMQPEKKGFKARALPEK